MYSYQRCLEYLADPVFKSDRYAEFQRVCHRFVVNRFSTLLVSVRRGLLPLIMIRHGDINGVFETSCLVFSTPVRKYR